MTDGETLQETLQKRIAQWRERARPRKMGESLGARLLSFAEAVILEQCADELKSDLLAVARAQEETPIGWQPIATAPADTEVLVWDAGAVSLALLDDGLWIDSGCGADFEPPPTHWMPLPPPPGVGR